MDYIHQNKKNMKKHFVVRVEIDVSLWCANRELKTQIQHDLMPHANLSKFWIVHTKTSLYLKSYIQTLSMQNFDRLYVASDVAKFEQKLKKKNGLDMMIYVYIVVVKIIK